MLRKEVLRSLSSDKKIFQSQLKGDLQILKKISCSVSVCVNLFFPTKNARTNLRLPTTMPQLMKATSKDPFMPRKEALALHLSRIYSERQYLWESEFFKPEEKDAKNIEIIFEKTSEILSAFQPPMNIKAPGQDGIFLHNLCGAQKFLAALLKAMKAQGKVPAGFKKSLIHPLFKKGDKKVFDCYRTISLRPIISNYLLRTYLKVCNEITRLTVLPFQMNRPKHNCGDNIFTLTRIIELCRSSNISLFILFTDLTKAFDSVCRIFLFNVLQNRCPSSLFSILKDLHIGTELFYEELRLLAESGVLQGDTLAAVLFVWVIDEIMREWEKKRDPKWGIKIVFRKGSVVKEFFPHEWHHMSNVEVHDLVVNWLAFADDIAFVSHHLQEILEAYRLFRNICKKVGLELNCGKCGLMSMDWNNVALGNSIQVDSDEIPVVSEYPYLGVQIESTGAFSKHLEMRSGKSLGVVASRIKSARSWIGKDISLLLSQLNLCFAPCLTWGTDVITLRKKDAAILDVTFHRFLRSVFRVRYDDTKKRFEKSNKELKEASGLVPPSETLPFARLKFFFHLLSPETVIPAECFFNGKIEEPTEGKLLKQDRRVVTYVTELRQNFLRFGILETPISVLRRPSYQKNILNECMQFGNSIFASIADKGIEISSQTLSFPHPHQNTNFVLATDGSLSQNKKEKTGGFGVVDSHGNFFSKSHECNAETSITTLEILAIKKALSLLVAANATNCHVFFLVDSLSAIKLVLGLDVRREDFQVLREIDVLRLSLSKQKVAEFFIHVRSHRNTPVPLNSLVDHVVGSFSKSTNAQEKSKCEPICTSAKCEACLWNEKVNAFISSFNPTTKNIFKD